MRNSFFRTIGIAAVSAAMITGTALPAFADQAPSTSLTVDKVLAKDANDYVPDETYTFEVAPGAADEQNAVIAGPVDAVLVNGTSIGTAGTFTIDGDPSAKDIGQTIVDIGSVSITFDTSKFTKPGIYRYTIDELGTDSADEDYDDTVYTMDVYYTNDGAISNVVAYSDASAKADAITFTNSIEGSGDHALDDLTVTKVVTGNMGEKTRNFNFTVTLKSGTGSYLAQAGNTTVTLNAQNPSATLSLQDGQSLVVYGLDSDAKVSVVEEDLSGEGYTTTYYSDYQQLTKESELQSTGGRGITADTTFTVENEKEVNITTGVVREYAPFILMVVLAGAVAVVFFRRKKA
jgi:pilin isopeptide linkage protein